MKINVDNYRTLSMREFLLDYVFLKDDYTSEEYQNWVNAVGSLEKNHATHLDLTELGIGYLVRLPYEAITEDDIAIGKVLLVEDFKSTPRKRRIAPYLRPSLVKQREENKGENENGKLFRR